MKRMIVIVRTLMRMTKRRRKKRKKRSQRRKRLKIPALRVIKLKKKRRLQVEEKA